VFRSPVGLFGGGGGGGGGNGTISFLKKINMSGATLVL
jgi:hypothetical protein